MLKPIPVLLALCALVGALTPRTQAQGGTGAAASSTSIALAGKTVMRIRSGAGGYTAAQRAQAVRERLIPILSLRRLKPGDVTVESIRPGQSNILVRGRLLLTVDGTLARANGESPERLAETWAANLRRTLPQTSVGGGPLGGGTQYVRGKL